VAAAGDYLVFTAAAGRKQNVKIVPSWIVYQDFPPLSRRHSFCPTADIPYSYIFIL
jgi:hypothetical protein